MGDLGAFHDSRHRMKSKEVEGGLILRVRYWALECQRQQWKVIGSDNQDSK